MSKVLSCWVSQNLNVHNQHQRVASCQELLDLYTHDKEKFCCRLVTGAKTWIHCWDPERKLESMQWKYVDCPPAKECRTQPPAGKSYDDNFLGILKDYLW